MRAGLVGGGARDKDSYTKVAISEPWYEVAPVVGPALNASRRRNRAVRRGRGMTRSSRPYR
jgi:hypothetical protein